MFDSILEKLIYNHPTMCIFSNICNSYLVIEHDGSVYPCDFFVRKDTELVGLWVNVCEVKT